MPINSLFRHGSFTLHSGASSNFLINALALNEHDLASLAALVAPVLRPFGKVYGIPRGGLRFAKALEQYATVGPRLIVDDVTTTGQSFADVWEPGDQGVVIFNRGRAPLPGVLSIFTLDRALI